MTLQKTAVDLTLVSTVPLFSPGEVHWDTIGRLWIYVEADAAIAQYGYVKISTDGNFKVIHTDDTACPNTLPAQLGCPQVAIADNSFGWVFRGYGAHKGKFAASCVHNVAILTTDTDGVMDDAGTEEVPGLLLLATITDAASADAWATGLLNTLK